MMQEDSPVPIIDYIDYSDGIKLFMRGVPYARKGFPTPEAVFATNVAKRAFMMMFNPLMLIGWKKNKERFERCASWSMSRFYLKPQNLCPTARELIKLPFGETAKIMAHIFEYDDAYRYRLQDVMSELNKENLFKNPRKELSRLVDLLIVRDTAQNMRDKFKTVKLFLWLLVPFKRKFLKSIKDLDLDKMKFDEDDRYWVLLRNDEYLFFGENKEQRGARLTVRPVMFSIKHNFPL